MLSYSILLISLDKVNASIYNDDINFYHIEEEVYMHLIVCVKISKEQFEFEKYTYADDVFALVTDGSFQFHRNGVDDVVNTCEGVCFEKGIWYTRKVITPVTLFLFRFQKETKLFPDEKITFRDINRIRSTIAFLDELNRWPNAERIAFQSDLFEDILTQYQIENMLPKPVNTPKNQEVFFDLDMLQRESGLNKRLSDIAAERHLSYVQFARRVKQASGMNPSRYLAFVRIEKAKHMLSETSLPIKTISAECGFENQYYFSNVFRKVCGISPSEYRKNLL